MGYHDAKRVMSVEFYKGDWILRAVLPGDRSTDENTDAAVAMAGWMARNATKYRETN